MWAFARQAGAVSRRAARWRKMEERGRARPAREAAWCAFDVQNPRVTSARAPPRNGRILRPSDHGTCGKRGYEGAESIHETRAQAVASVARRDHADSGGAADVRATCRLHEGGVP